MYYAADAFKGVMLGIPAQYGLDVLVLLTWAAIGLGVGTFLLKHRQAAL
jgi:hypothetical protein